MKSLITLILVISTKCSYTPFDKENGINSIYGTGDELLDVIYKTKCSLICDGSQFPCCTGNRMNSIQCKNKEYCQDLVNKLQEYLVRVTLQIYFSLVALVGFVFFILFYCLTYKTLTFSQKSNGILCQKSCWVNGLVAVLLVLSVSLVIPIAILLFIARCKNVSLTKLLGGDFSSISSVNLITSIEIKNETRRNGRKHPNMISNDYAKGQGSLLTEGAEAIRNEVDYDGKVTSIVKLPIKDKV